MKFLNNNNKFWLKGGKNYTRDEIEKATKEYLDHGGKITQLPDIQALIPDEISNFWYNENWIKVKPFKPKGNF